MVRRDDSKPTPMAAFRRIPAWLGPALAVGVVLGLEGLRAANVRIPNPPALLMPVVVVSAFWGGRRLGLISAAVGVLYNLFSFSAPGQLGSYTPDDLVRVSLWALIMPGTAWLVGWLRDRLERAEHAALEASEDRFSKAFGSSPLAMAVIQVDRDAVLQANPAFLQLVGWGAEELPTRPFSALLTSPLQPVEMAWQAETMLKRSGGELVTTLASFERIELQGERCLLGFFYDITERRRLEESLRQAHKMEAIGRLAGGIAHDFNNLLVVINAGAQLLADPRTSSSERDQVAREILEAGQRAAGLTSQLLAFSRKQPLRVHPVSLTELVTSGLPLFKRLLPASVEVRAALAPGLPLVRADRGQLDQVLLNLVTNASEAMPRGGQLSIATERALCGGAPGVCLRVSDTGEGMGPETMKHLFEPFFTSRSSGKGTGLGLATVYAVVKQAGGEVLVESQPGKGARFSVVLPAYEGAAPHSETPGLPASGRSRGEAILVVEDEPLVRSVACRALRAAGYQVLEAGDAPEALALVGACKGPIHLLLTDVVLPGANGRELATRLLGVRPGLRVLFMSGHTNDPVLDGEVLEARASLLQKPFTPDQLERRVAEVLDGPAHDCRATALTRP